MSYRVVDLMGEWTDRQTGARAVMAELSADTASDLPANTADLQYVLGSWSRTVDTGDIYRINSSGVWILQPSQNAFSNVYTKSEIDSMITEIYGIIAYYHTVIVSDTGEITFYALAGYIGTWTIYGNGQQTGTPTPDAPIMPTFCGTLDGTDWKIPITCAEQTVSVNLGQTQTVRRIRKLVLTGNEDWLYIASDTLPYFRFKVGNANTVIQNMIISTHLPQSEITTLTTAVGVDIRNISSQNAAFINLRASELGADVPSCKAYLAAQYADGTPVVVWYVLAATETAIVNEPLVKIGDYADELSSTDAGVQIPTVQGENTLTVDTELKPSRIEIHG